MDEMNEEMLAGSDFDDLEDLFGSDLSDMAANEQVMLTQNLDGFASCFPDWDLHPPVQR